MGGGAPPADIGRLQERELSDAAEVLARAFRDNPLNRAVIRGGPERRLRANLHGMRALLPVARVHGEVWALRDEGGVRAALVAVPPHMHPLPPPPWPARLRCLLGQGLGVAMRWAAVFEQLEGEHPAEPHWYVGTVGVDPPAQGRGAGSALLHGWIGRLDTEPAPVWLETDRPENVAFYERVGFEVCRELDVQGVHVWCMRRGVLGAGAG